MSAEPASSPSLTRGARFRPVAALLLASPTVDVRERLFSILQARFQPGTAGLGSALSTPRHLRAVAGRLGLRH